MDEKEDVLYIGDCDDKPKEGTSVVVYTPPTNASGEMFVLGASGIRLLISLMLELMIVSYEDLDLSTFRISDKLNAVYGVFIVLLKKLVILSKERRVAEQ